MKLLMTADAVGGVWTYALDLARALRAYGVETVLALNGPPPSRPPDDVEVIATGLPLDWLAETPEEVRDAGVRLVEIAGDLRVDVVQLNSPAYGADVRFPAPIVGVQHSCTATWWRAVRGNGAWPRDFAWRYDLAQRGLHACDAVVAPSLAFAAAVQAEYQLPAPPRVVWNGRAPAVRPLGATYSNRVLTAGRLWDEGKGMACLDAAAARLSMPVIAAGPLAPPGGAPVHFQHVRTPGILSPETLRLELAGASAFVAPSLYEPFGLAVLEAAQLGLPLVLSDIPVFRELWWRAAVFFRAGDADDLARTLDGLHRSATGRNDVAWACGQRALRYTVEAMAKGMMDVFTGIQLPRS